MGLASHASTFRQSATEERKLRSSGMLEPRTKSEVTDEGKDRVAKQRQGQRAAIASQLALWRRPIMGLASHA